MKWAALVSMDSTMGLGTRLGLFFSPADLGTCQGKLCLFDSRGSKAAFK